MTHLTCRCARRQPLRSKTLPIRQHKRAWPQPKTPQQRLAEYRQAQRRLWRAVLQPIFPPRTTRRRNGLRSVRLAW